LDYSTIEIVKLALSLPIPITIDSHTRKTLVRKRAAIKTKMTHIKKYIDNLPYTVDMHDIAVRLQLLERVWEEYNATQDQLEYQDDNKTQQHELDRETFTETYCELKARIERMISEDRQTKDVKLAQSQKHRATHDLGNRSEPKIKLLNYSDS